MTCQHTRTEFVYRRDGVDYVRCLECDSVFEAEDLEAVPAFDEDDEPEPAPAHARKKPR